jgi:large subunit ribosomal protein L19
MKAQKLTSETILSLGVIDRKFPVFRIGDTIAVHQFVTEGEKERIQTFEGDVLAIHHKGVCSTFTVRKIGSNNVAVERILPFYSPTIKSIDIVRRGKTRRAKAYYMRERTGKATRFKELVLTKQQKQSAAAKDRAA